MSSLAKSHEPPQPTPISSAAISKPSQSGFHSEDGPRPLAEEAFDESLDDDFETDALVIPEDELGETLGRRAREGTHRRGRPDRRSGAHLPDADGRDSHAQPPGRDGRGEADRSRPPRIPLQHVGHRLYPSRGDRLAGEHPRQPAAIGSHDRSLGGQPPRKGPAAEGIDAESADPASPDVAEQARLRAGHPSPPADEASPAGLAAAAESPRQGGAAGRGDGTSHATLAAAAAKAPADFPADGRDSPATGGRPAATRPTFSAPPSFARNSAT